MIGLTHSADAITLDNILHYKQLYSINTHCEDHKVLYSWFVSRACLLVFILSASPVIVIILNPDCCDGSMHCKTHRLRYANTIELVLLKI